MRLPLRPLLFASTLAAAAGPLLAASPAFAQFIDAGVTSTTFSSDDFFIGVQHEAGANLSDFDVARFFNKARCDCNETVFVYVALTDSGFAKRTTVDRTGNIEFWVGSQCASNDSGRPLRCQLLGSQTMAAFLNEGRATSPTNARVLSTYTNTIIIGDTTGGTFTPNPDCTLPSGIQSFNQTIFVITYDANGGPVTLASRQVLIDLTPPPAPDPKGIIVQGGDEAVTISWPRVDSSIITDLLGYQVLCNRAGELQVFNDGTFAAGFQECNVPGGDAGVGSGENDGGVNGLDPRFICSPLLSATASSFRVKILQNGIYYGVGVVAIDISGNASLPNVMFEKAIATKSFYEVYRNDDDLHPGAANGGLCALGARTSARGTAAGLGAALAIAAAVVAIRRRRHK
ncbi:MAG TPA: hypothetical protein VIF57_00235 [Polyangia bacterium]